MSNGSDVHAMFVYSKRLETFLGWPYVSKDGAKCVAEKMAATGFFRPNPESEPDLARCFMCKKEMEGWEPNDDPHDEHRMHSSKCPFLHDKGKDLLDITIADDIKLFYVKEIQSALKASEKFLAEFNQKHETCCDELKN
nr:baculoviral IAP repeat-containing protein 5-like [Ciona intestinalis]|eukprot:XP_009857913.1 baculoviral IAP repeat-containing protein 5-like [Ciona intestinalis]